MINSYFLSFLLARSADLKWEPTAIFGLIFSPAKLVLLEFRFACVNAVEEQCLALQVLQVFTNRFGYTNLMG
jgi:hypothetical protein